MKRHNDQQNLAINQLVSEYESMSQNGNMRFYDQQIFLQLIEYYQQQEDIERAYSVVEHAIRQHQYTVDFYIFKARLLVEKAQHENALQCLVQAQSLAPSELEIQLLRAEILTALDRAPEAFALLSELHQYSSREATSEIFFCEACIYEHLEQFDQMFAALRDAILANPKNKTVLKRLWLSVELSSLYEESIELHQHLIDLDPYCHISWYNLGHAYFCLNDYTHAAEAFEYAYLIDEQFESAYRDCADSLIMLKSYDKALACLEECAEHIQPGSELLLSIGFCQEHTEQQSLAKKSYLAAIQQDAENDAAYFRLGECFSNERNWDNAITAYCRAVEINDRQEEYYASLGNAYFQIEEIEKSIQCLKLATDTAPEQIQYWMQYAGLLLDLLRPDEAVIVLDEADMYTGGHEIKYARIACMILCGQRQRAFDLLKNALNDDFEKHSWIFEIAPELEEDRDLNHLIAAYQP